MNDCIFCKIVKKEVSASILMEKKRFIVFKDINPSADVHYLIVPKDHINSYVEFNSEHKDLLFDMHSVAQQIIKDKKIEGGYKIIFNGGKYQFVPHVHMHLMGGEMKKTDY